MLSFIIDKQYISNLNMESKFKSKAWKYNLWQNKKKNEFNAERNIAKWKDWITMFATWKCYTTMLLSIDYIIEETWQEIFEKGICTEN